jgi:hypothetical protein
MLRIMRCAVGENQRIFLSSAVVQFAASPKIATGDLSGAGRIDNGSNWLDDGH